MANQIHNYLRQKKFLILLFVSILLFFIQQQIGYGMRDEKTFAADDVVEVIFGNEVADDSLTFKNISPSLLLISQKDNKENKYAVIKHIDGQYKIIEYGQGEIVPYQQSIIFNEEIKAQTPNSFKYISPIESYWQFNNQNNVEEIIYIDGASGEWLPDIKSKGTVSIYKETWDHYLNAQSQLVNEFNNQQGFDSSSELSWLINSERKELTQEEIIKQIANNVPLIYQGTKFNEQVLFAYSITGYQLWDNALFLNLYDETFNLNRYVLYEDLIQYGRIYEK